MTVEAKGRDGLGWYILEVEGEAGEPLRYYLRHWTRYNLREAASAEAERMFRGERVAVGFWTGAAWDRSTFRAVAHA
jgi:hypothetical protein